MKKQAMLQILWFLAILSLVLLLFWYEPQLQKELTYAGSGGRSAIWDYLITNLIMLAIHMAQGILLLLVIPPWRFQIQVNPIYALVPTLVVFLGSIAPMLYVLEKHTTIFRWFALTDQLYLIEGCQILLGLLLGVLLVCAGKRVAARGGKAGQPSA